MVSANNDTLDRWEVARLRAAVHEAGHGVVIHLLGGPVVQLQIYQRRMLGPWGGSCRPGIATLEAPDRLGASDETRLAAATAAMAGVVAEDLLHEEYEKAWINDSWNLGHSDRIFADRSLPSGQGEGAKEARSLLFATVQLVSPP
jgi:hypothetical protein